MCRHRRSRPPRGRRPSTCSSSATAGSAIVALPLSPDGYEGASGERPPGEASATTASGERLAGIRAAFEAAGIDWPPSPIEERAPHGRDAGRRAAAALLDRAERPTALLAMSDELAIGALHAAEERGIAVPA